MGVGQPRQCGPCSNCSRCSVWAADMTAHKKGELRLIEGNIILDTEKRVVTFQYPIIKDASPLDDNKAQVTAIATRGETRLEKKNLREKYEDEVCCYLDRGTFVKLTQDDWDGPFNYISHHEVIKPGSTSTKLRIVSNLSLDNNNSGLSYNDSLPKGPSSLVPLLETMVT